MDFFFESDAELSPENVNHLLQKTGIPHLKNEIQQILKQDRETRNEGITNFINTLTNITNTKKEKEEELDWVAEWVKKYYPNAYLSLYGNKK